MLCIKQSCWSDTWLILNIIFVILVQKVSYIFSYLIYDIRIFIKITWKLLLSSLLSSLSSPVLPLLTALTDSMILWQELELDAINAVRENQLALPPTSHMIRKLQAILQPPQHLLLTAQVDLVTTRKRIYVKLSARKDVKLVLLTMITVPTASTDIHGTLIILAFQLLLD